MEPLPGAPPVNGHYSKELWNDKKNWPQLQPHIPVNTYKNVEDMCHLPHWTDYYNDGPTLNDPEGPAPAPPPPRYCDSVKNFEKRAEQIVEEGSVKERAEIRNDVPDTHYLSKEIIDYVPLHKDVKERAALGLF